MYKNVYTVFENCRRISHMTYNDRQIENIP